jgi:4a-hydroxytetrahydrobiopterin dehydratase
MPSTPELASASERAAFAAAHPDWELDDDTIRRTFRFADFAEAIGFVNRTALAAEAADHHPDIDIRWNRVTLTLSTHSAGGLTHLDFELADRIDGFVTG